ncbi:DNA polymerase-3 subunit alpha [Evansella vedderi]|uniref:DNA polymerase III subunit alpha n=1 Tax=Evansella vedderi TaxID=38282 RepID=A0ABT9ZY37_9BACI|nr:DNA polymerase III subunit alpha [Evansella vedderi]MDQ0255040.1 DNA polymerase-3 subunit alpha [Evansella vedderi]
MSFVHLHVHSEYSLLRSTGKIKELVSRAKSLGYTALALTDVDAMYGVIPFYKACKESGIHPIIGVELAYAPDDHNDTEAIKNRIVLLAENNEGYKSLTRLTTYANERYSRFSPYITYSDLEKNNKGMIAIVPFAEGFVQGCINNGQTVEASNHFQWLQQTFGENNVFIEIQNHWQPSEREKLLKLSEWLKDVALTVPLVASNHVHFTVPEQRSAHKVMQAIRLGMKLEELPNRYSSEHYYLKSPEEMIELFHNWQGACAETVRISNRCHVTIELGQAILPHFPVPDGRSAKEYLKHLCYEGMRERYSNPVPEITKRLEYELKVISEMNYEDYFLIVADFMNYAHQQNILTGPGRGSAAGSIVAYVLKITDVDPIKYGLLFERFLNPERISMPDIDIDFPDNRRDEVIQYVKDKYGKDHVAQIITFGTLAAKAAVRDVGRVLGIELAIIDKIAKNIPSRPQITLDQAISESPFLKEWIEKEEQIKELFKIARDVEGLPRHSSIHAAGVVMSKNPLIDVVPLQEGNDGLYLTQFPMGDLEEIGLLKMDFLGLRNLSFIELILRSVKENRGVNIQLSSIPLDDKKTFELLGKGETSGIFQLESSGMKSVLKRLKPTEFEDIVAVNALYRPGPMENIPLYIKRKHGEENVIYPHPTLEPILKTTHGVLIYQEQIMQIASKMAGFSLGEADILRRAVGKKKLEVLEQEREKFIKGSLKQGYSEEVASQMYNLIVRFANYGFNRSHAVAYSIIAYYLAYLKANYPIEFISALMGTVVHHHEKLGEYVAEARRQGIIVHPPSINTSGAQFTIKNGEIWIGLAAVKNVGLPAVQSIVKEREVSPFQSLFDLCTRIPAKVLPKRAIDALVVAGALDELHPERAQLLASVEEALEYGEKYREHTLTMQTELFYEELKEPEYISVPPLSEREQLNFEKQVLGFYASGHPIESELTIVAPYFRLPLHGVKEKKGNEEVVRIAGLVEDVKVIQTKKKQQMAFVHFTDETGSIDLTVFPAELEKNRLKLQKGELLFVEGKRQEHNGEVKIILVKCITISNLKAKQAKKEKGRLYLKISTLMEKQNKLDQLKKILEDNPGDISVILYYERTKKAITLTEMWNVSSDKSFLMKLKGMLGVNNVILKSGTKV